MICSILYEGIYISGCFLNIDVDKITINGLFNDEIYYSSIKEVTVKRKLIYHIKIIYLDNKHSTNEITIRIMGKRNVATIISKLVESGISVKELNK